MTLHKVNAEKIMALNNHRGLGNMKVLSMLGAPMDGTRHGAPPPKWMVHTHGGPHMLVIFAIPPITCSVASYALYPSRVLVPALLGVMQMGNFSYVPAPLKLGHLAGNRFSIILRQVSTFCPIVAQGHVCQATCIQACRSMQLDRAHTVYCGTQLDVSQAPMVPIMCGPVLYVPFA